MKYLLNLNVRSNYSFLSSAISLDQYLDFALKNNLKILSLTEKNVLNSSYKFYQLCEANNIKPLIGLECEWNNDNNIINLVVMSKNYQGYQTLVQLSTLLNTTKTELENCDVLNHLANNDNVVIIIKFEANFIEKINEIIKILNPHNANAVFIGIGENDQAFIGQLQTFMTEIVPLNLVTYLESEEASVQQVLLAIKNQKTLNEEELVSTGENYYQPQAFYEKNFSAEIVSNIEKISNLCNLKIPQFSKHKRFQDLPKFPCPNNLTSNQYLKELCFQGLSRRLPESILNEQYLNRLNYELEVIKKMMFDDYFLIVYDYIQFAKNNNILAGPGRGSVAGSLVAYVLGITDVDPIKYGLIFERFLNSERLSFPDIDVDIQDYRRDEIFLYLSKKYNMNRVAHIATFQKNGCRMTIRDLGRVFKIPKHDISEMSKLILLQYNFNLKLALNHSPLLQKYALKYPYLFNLATKIVGFPRQTGTHAAGVILSHVPLDEIIPLQLSFNGIYQTQFPMEDLEAIGFIKMDILGLRNLTLLQNILQKIKEYHNVEINLNAIPLIDEATFALMQKGDTTGVFQLESQGMRQVAITLQVNSFEDIVATNALFRPGPQDYINNYARRKFNIETVNYAHKDLIPYLKNTYGIIVYQEQILLILQKIAGYSLAQADIIRRGIAKKRRQELYEQESNFLESSQKQGYSLAVAAKIWNEIREFANYGFNRSHAIAYSLLGYWLAYLKTHYRVIFMAGLLNSVINSKSRLRLYIKESKRYNIKISPPSVNFGAIDFNINIKEQSLTFSLLAINNMSKKSCQLLINERNKNGLYTDFFNFCSRVTFAGLTKRNIESLIYAGALDEINSNRTLLLANLEVALAYAKITKKKDLHNKSWYLDLTLSAPPLIQVSEDWRQSSINEYKTMRLHLKYHPEKLWKNSIDPYDYTIALSKIHYHLQESVLVWGRITSRRIVRTKNNKLMAFFRIESDATLIDVTAFSEIYHQFVDQIQHNKIILMQARVHWWDKKPKLILNKVIESLSSDY